MNNLTLNINLLFLYAMECDRVVYNVLSFTIFQTTTDGLKFVYLNVSIRLYKSDQNLQE